LTEFQIEFKYLQRANPIILFTILKTHLGMWNKASLKKMFGLKGILTELANVSVVHLRDPGSKLCIDRKDFLVLFVSYFNYNL
jgi:hypothetical protein